MRKWTFPLQEELIKYIRGESTAQRVRHKYAEFVREHRRYNETLRPGDAYAAASSMGTSPSPMRRFESEFDLLKIRLGTSNWDILAQNPQFGDIARRHRLAVAHAVYHYDQWLKGELVDTSLAGDFSTFALQQALNVGKPDMDLKKEAEGKLQAYLQKHYTKQLVLPNKVPLIQLSMDAGERGHRLLLFQFLNSPASASGGAQYVRLRNVHGLKQYVVQIQASWIKDDNFSAVEWAIAATGMRALGMGRIADINAGNASATNVEDMADFYRDSSPFSPGISLIALTIEDSTLLSKHGKRLEEWKHLWESGKHRLMHATPRQILAMQFLLSGMNDSQILEELPKVGHPISRSTLAAEFLKLKRLLSGELDSVPVAVGAAA